MDRFLLLVAVLVVALGLVLHFGYEVPWLSNWLGKLPGDITIKKGGVVIYIPLATSLLISIVLSLVGSLFFKSSK